MSSVPRGRPKRGWLIKSFVSFFVLMVGGVCFGSGFAYSIATSFSKGLPDVKSLSTYEPSESTYIYSSDGVLIGTLFRENRQWVPLSQIPQVMQQAIVAIEDSRFYDHNGVDFVGVARSFLVNVIGGQTEQGASTITMQLARAVFLTRDVTIERKIREILLAMEIEKHYSKTEILELYLNQIYLGSGSYGVQAACETYFGTPIQKITLPEAAMLAGLPQAPTLYSPQINPRAAKSRQFLVLHRMAGLGFITEVQARHAVRTRLPVRPLTQEVGVLKYPYFTSYVIYQLSQRFPPAVLYRGGLRVYTTLDTRLQKLAEKAVRDGVERNLKDGYNAHQSALVSLENGTGYLRAMVGGYKWSNTDQFNRAWQATRQPGSSFKIYVYSTALELGYTPQSMIPDSPLAIRIYSYETYCPHNSDYKWWGPTSMLRCFQMSRDIPAIRLANVLGIQNVIDTAHKMGVEEDMLPMPPLALGAVDLTLLEHAAGVSVIPNMGVRIDPTAIKVIKDSDGNVLEDNRNPYRQQILSEQTCMSMLEMMKKVIEAGTGTTADIGREAGGKTGTTDSHRDAWFAGCTPELTTVVWAGNDDNTPTGGGFGSTLAAPTWGEFMKAALAGHPKRYFGEDKKGKISLLMCSDSHERASATCPHTYRKSFEPGKLPLTWCKLHTFDSVGYGYSYVNRWQFRTPNVHFNANVAASNAPHPAEKKNRIVSSAIMPRWSQKKDLYPSRAAYAPRSYRAVSLPNARNLATYPSPSVRAYRWAPAHTPRVKTLDQPVYYAPRHSSPAVSAPPPPAPSRWKPARRPTTSGQDAPVYYAPRRSATPAPLASPVMEIPMQIPGDSTRDF